MRRAWTVYVLAGALGLAAAGVSADTVVKNDGSKYSGVVTKTDTGYAVKMKAGSITIPAEEVDHIIKESAPAAVPPTVPGTSGAVSPTATLVAPVTPAPTTKRPGAKVVDAKTLQALLDQGQAALAAGEYKAAADAFKDVLTLDPRNVIALHGAGAAYMYLHDFAKAKEPMEKAIVANPSPDRALVMNMAVMQIAVRNPMRGAKIIKDYLTAHNKVLDEPMLNAMAIALNDADDQAKKLRLYVDCAQFYAGYNAQLEAQVPGQKRWGVDWLPAEKVDENILAVTTKQKEADRLIPQLDDAIARVEVCQKEVEHEAPLVSRGFFSEFDLQSARQNVLAAIAERDRLSDAYDAAVAAIPRPHLPKALSLVALNDLTPPRVKGVTLAIAPTVQTSPEYIAPAIKPSMKRLKPAASSSGGGTGNTANQPPAPPAIEVVQVKPAEVRKVQITSYAVAFPVSANLVITSAAALQDATSIALQTADGGALKGELVRTDESSGLALVRISGRTLSPLEISAAFPGGSVQCAGYPNVNIFNPAAELMTGFSAAPKDGWKIRLDQHPRLSGGPLLSGGRVVGVELATRDSETAAIPAATLDQLRKLVGDDLPKSPSLHPDPAGVLLQVLATRESK